MRHVYGPHRGGQALVRSGRQEIGSPGGIGGMGGSCWVAASATGAGAPGAPGGLQHGETAPRSRARSAAATRTVAPVGGHRQRTGVRAAAAAHRRRPQGDAGR